jgi:tRNA pseudouridine38-40 synthase
VWWVKDKLDVKKMKETSEVFLGMHDFKSYSDKNAEDKSTKCLVEMIEVTESEDKIYIRIKASHFLWKMVRRIAGTLVEAGRGNFAKEDLETFLNSYSEEPAKYTAPPSGLFLEKIEY